MEICIFSLLIARNWGTGEQYTWFDTAVFMSSIVCNATVVWKYSQLSATKVFILKQSDSKTVYKLSCHNNYVPYILCRCWVSMARVKSFVGL